MELSQAYMDYYHSVNRLLEAEGKMMFTLKETDDIAFTPTKKYQTDAGYDCRARIDEAVIIEPGKRARIPLGFGINIPLNHTGDLRPRSGLTDSSGIMVGYGTIDTGYTGEVKATVFNFGDETFIVSPKDRIAQLVVLPIVHSANNHPVQLVQVDTLHELERGEKGHGSSGVK